MHDQALNLRYSLWRENAAKDAWVERLANWLETSDLSRSRTLLRRGGLTASEADRLSAVLQVTSEDLLFGRPFEGVDVLEHNLKHVFESLGHGSKKWIAEALGIDQTNISKWLSGRSRPSSGHQAALAKVLGIAPDQPLDSYPHFLSDEPASDQARRQWLHERLDEADAEELRSLFPALRRLLEQ